MAVSEKDKGRLVRTPKGEVGILYEVIGWFSLVEVNGGYLIMCNSDRLEVVENKNSQEE